MSTYLPKEVLVDAFNNLILTNLTPGTTIRPLFWYLIIGHLDLNGVKSWTTKDVKIISEQLCEIQNHKAGEQTYINAFEQGKCPFMLTDKSIALATMSSINTKPYWPENNPLIRKLPGSKNPIKYEKHDSFDWNIWINEACTSTLIRERNVDSVVNLILISLRNFDLGENKQINGSVIIDKFKEIYGEAANAILKNKTGVPISKSIIKRLNEILKEKASLSEPYGDLIDDFPLEPGEPSKISSKVSNNSDGWIHQWMLQGGPGTGKSHKMNEKVKGFDPERVIRTVFHAETTHASFVGEYLPLPIFQQPGLKERKFKDYNGKEFKKGRPFITYQFSPGPLAKALLQAWSDPRPVVLIIEEINRCAPAAAFGEFLQSLDRDGGVSEYGIQVPEPLEQWMSGELKGKKPGIPKGGWKFPANLYLWATFNKADQGVRPLDAAFLRRWTLEHIGVDENVANAPNPSLTFAGVTSSWQAFRKLLNDTMLSPNGWMEEDHLIGPFFLKEEEFGTNVEDKTNAVFSKVLAYIWTELGADRNRIFSGNVKTLSQLKEALKPGDPVDKNNPFQEDFLKELVRRNKYPGTPALTLKPATGTVLETSATTKTTLEAMSPAEPTSETPGGEELGAKAADKPSGNPGGGAPS